MKLKFSIFALAFCCLLVVLYSVKSSIGTLFEGQAYVQQNAGNLNGAITNYSRAILLEKNPANAYYNRGLVKSAKGDSKGAIEDYSRAVELDPGLSLAYRARGMERLKSDLEEAIKDFSMAILRDPSAENYYCRGYAKSEQSKWDEAIVDFDRALKADPRYVTAYLGRASIKHYKGDIQGAKADYSRALEIDPQNGTARYGRASTYSTNQTEVLGELDQAIRNDPTLAEAFCARGNIKSTQHKWEEAVADYNRALKLKPKMIDALMQRGAIEQRKGQTFAAIVDYNQALEINPNVAQIYLGKGQCHSTLHEWADALKNYRKYCEKSTTGQVDYAQINIWICRTRQNEGAAATAELTTYFTSHQGTWAAKVAEHLEGKLTREELIKEAQATSDDTKKRQQLCEAYYYAGLKRLIGGDKESAREDFRRCIDTEVVDFVEYDYARQELKML